MRDTGDYKALFIDDAPEGGMMVECQNCGEENQDRTKWGEPLYCARCDKELYYPPGASW